MKKFCVFMQWFCAAFVVYDSLLAISGLVEKNQSRFWIGLINAVIMFGLFFYNQHLEGEFDE